MSIPGVPQDQLDDISETATPSAGGSNSREGSREIHDGMIVSEVMDWCNKNGAIIPYRLWAKQIQAGNLANSVRQTDERSHVMGSIVLVSHGDAPGAFGIRSGTHNAECTPMTWSETVRSENRNMVRHDDLWWMNHKNSYGRLVYVVDPNDYPTIDPQPVKAKMQVAQVTETASSAPKNVQFQQAVLPGTPQGAGGYYVPPGASAPDQAAQEAIGLEGSFRVLGQAVKEVVRIARGKKRNCPERTFCFKGPNDPAQIPEYNDQLKMQNETLNRLPPCQYLMNRASYKYWGSDTMQSFSKNARSRANSQFRRNGGITTNKAALHRLDMVAGGDPDDIARMGDASINSKIGTDWKNVTDDLDQYADQMCEEGCPNLRAILKIC